MIKRKFVQNTQSSVNARQRTRTNGGGSVLLIVMGLRYPLRVHCLEFEFLHQLADGDALL
jgi:hypothetical protein